MKNKTWFVAVDRPGQGWKMHVEAPSKSAAIKLAGLKMGETPDVVREVEGTIAEIELRRENQKLKAKLMELAYKINELHEEVKSLIEA